MSALRHLIDPLVRSFVGASSLWRKRSGFDDVIGINRRNVELVYQYNRRGDYPLVDDKIRCKELLEARSVPVAPTIAVCEGLFAIPSTMQAIDERSDFVVKPASGSGGDGILVTRRRVEDGWELAGGGLLTAGELRHHLANVVFGTFSKQLDDRALVEERIVPHPFFEELADTGLGDIRLIVLQGECLMAMLRLPTSQSGGRANLHQGGIGVAVDLGTGRTTRAVWRRRGVETHPETGVALVDRQLPHWEETLEVGRRAAECVPLGYLGVDIVVDAVRGPMVLELNARPGLEIQNVNDQALGPLVERVER